MIVVTKTIVTMTTPKTTMTTMTMTTTMITMMIMIPMMMLQARANTHTLGISSWGSTNWSLSRTLILNHHRHHHRLHLPHSRHRHHHHHHHHHDYDDNMRFTSFTGQCHTSFIDSFRFTSLEFLPCIWTFYILSQIQIYLYGILYMLQHWQMY